MWAVWGDGGDGPVAEGLSETAMRRMVDDDETHTLYGENEATDELYEG